jgi:hypothetical protein
MSNRNGELEISGGSAAAFALICLLVGMLAGGWIGIQAEREKLRVAIKTKLTDAEIGKALPGLAQCVADHVASQAQK